MQYRKLGNTDIDVSVICLGTMTWGEQNTQDEGWEQMDYALDKGVNFFDTAELYSTPARAETYGSTEVIIGNWLEARKNREKVILGTKIAGPGAYTKHIRDTAVYTPQYLEEAIEGSLRRLKTDYIDLYQIHWPERPANYFGVRVYEHQDGWEDNFKMRLEVLQKFVEKGQIKHIGISNETPWGTMNYLKLADQFGLPRIAAVQNPYNLLNRSYEVGLAEMSIREHCGLLAYSPLACGRLTNKYIEGTDTPNCRLNLFNQYVRYNSDNCMLATKQYYYIAKEAGLSLAQLACAWINRQPFVTSNIIGATKMAQLKENIESIDIVLDDSIIKKINEVHEMVPDPAS